MKYSVLPSILKPEELTGGNGLVEMGTSLSILVGGATVLCIVLLAAGCARYRRSLALEDSTQAALRPAQVMP